MLLIPITVEREDSKEAVEVARLVIPSVPNVSQPTSAQFVLQATTSMEKTVLRLLENSNP